MPVLPMFPLGTVLLPGAVLPLHVFEERYRALVRDCLAAPEHEFGVVMIERGSEVGGGDQRSDVGTVARMAQVAELADGRYALVCLGTRRIKVLGWLPDDPYPAATVEDWPDDEDDTATLAHMAEKSTGRVRRAVALATELGDRAGDATTDVSDDLVLATYQLAGMAPIGPIDAHRLLCAPGPTERLALLDLVLDDVEAGLRFRLQADER